jgi:chaperonin cofactor prefoldin
MSQGKDMPRSRRRFYNSSTAGRPRYEAANIDGSHLAGVISDLALLEAAQDRQDQEIKGFRSYVGEVFAKFDAKLDAIDHQIVQQSRTNWPVIIGLCFGGFSIAVTLTSGAYFLTSQQMQVLVQPLHIKTESLTGAVDNFASRMEVVQSRLAASEGAIQASVDKDARSEEDRDELHKSVERNIEAISSLNSQIRGVSEKLLEVETQFDAAAQIENVRWDNAQRTLAMLWERLWPGSRYPDRSAFHPNISGRHVARPGN